MPTSPVASPVLNAAKAENDDESASPLLLAAEKDSDASMGDLELAAKDANAEAASEDVKIMTEENGKEASSTGDAATSVSVDVADGESGEKEKEVEKNVLRATIRY